MCTDMISLACQVTDDQTFLEFPPWLQVFINSLLQNVTEGTDSEDFCLVKKCFHFHQLLKTSMMTFPGLLLLHNGT